MLKNGFYAGYLNIFFIKLIIYLPLPPYKNIPLAFKKVLKDSDCSLTAGVSTGFQLSGGLVLFLFFNSYLFILFFQGHRLRTTGIYIFQNFASL